MASSSNLIPWLFAACGQPRCAQGKSQTKRHTGSLNFLPKKGFADELCVFCARVGAGEGGGGEDTADIEAASCVFLCLHGGQRGRRWRAATVYLRVDRTCLWWQTWRSNRRRGAAYSPALQVLAIYLCTTTKMLCYTVRSRRAPLDRASLPNSAPSFVLRAYSYADIYSFAGRERGRRWCLISRCFFSPSLTFPPSISSPTIMASTRDLLPSLPTDTRPLRTLY